MSRGGGVDSTSATIVASVALNLGVATSTDTFAEERLAGV
jgi:hypothetical protein